MNPVFSTPKFLPSKTLLNLNVNGRSVAIDADPETPLLWVIREWLELTGTKFGCGRGLCGACTVHVDGSPVRSCSIPASFALGRNITTIEGLSGDEQLHPLQSAWITESVPQCGYCQSGQIMTAAALLKQNPTPDDSAIDAAMSGNICRCGTYPRIRKAIKRAAQAVAAVEMYEPTSFDSTEASV